MDRTKLKNYAPKARREFIEAMVERAAFYGLTADKTEPIVEKGDVAVIGGRSFPIAVARKRKSLEDRIKRHGFQQTMEAMAYTWFNRLVAIRYMELHGYLDHGYRVLSHPDGKATPEILEHAEHVDFPGLKKDRVIDLKLAGNKEGELYRLLLTAQCNALHTAMPFLFERIDDETELLLPDNLLNSDSLIRKLVNEIDEADWQEVEIIGWLYQFYISEKKDEVIGKVVASEDIPAATQLFTPNWIVKYLVQNTLGRQWLATYPESPLRQQMEYYIEPAEQTLEVQEQLKAITPTSLNPEELTLLDPACGSGHILVEAYDLFKAIYQERGYRAKDIPALILQKNLFGMEIDDRAAQLAAFALMMKARADDRRIFESEAKPNIVAFEDSQGMKASEVHFALTSPLNGEKKDELESPAPDGHLFEPDDNLFTRAEAVKATASRMSTTVNFSQADIASLLELFENGKTFGSLIQVPPKLVTKLPEIEKRLDDVLTHGDLTHASAHILKPFLQQARLLARQYDAVVANPPYMGSKSLPTELRDFARSTFPAGKSDLFAVFLDRISAITKKNGLIGAMTPFTWMFLSSYESFRQWLLDHHSLCSLVQPEYHAFFDSAYVPICASVIRKCKLDYAGTFINLSKFYGEELQPCKTLVAIRDPQCDWRYTVQQSEFDLIPGIPIAFSASRNFRRLFADYPPLSNVCTAQKGLATCDNARFVRFWWEVAAAKIGRGVSTCDEALDSGLKWFPFNKGGEFRRWFGNLLHVVNWKDDGEEIKAEITARYPYLKGNTSFVTQDTSNYFRRAIVWTYLSSSDRAFRLSPGGEIASNASQCAYSSEETLLGLLAYLNSSVVTSLMRLISPTLNANLKEFLAMPFPTDILDGRISSMAGRLVEISQDDWNSQETSFDYIGSPMLKVSGSSLPCCFASWEAISEQTKSELLELETKINQSVINALKLEGEIDPQSSAATCVLLTPDSKASSQCFLSFVIGCMMGRYSFDKPGLIYAHGGNEEFDASHYKTFPADDDGIIPLLETDWGIRDDAMNRFEEFVSVAWPKEHLEENLKFVADSLGPNNGEQPRETIRRYLATGFYKHHLSMYKKRPIYWLFSSGKLRAFQCLAYLHRYNEGTLARMRTEYVIPLQGQIAARIDQLEGDKAKATGTSHRNKIQKEQDKLKKQQVELASFEEKLKHYADMRISLDLDDGVKVNYAKFGDLLAESKAITGGKDDE